MIEYEIISYNNISDLVRHTRELIRDGWMPLGGATASTHINETQRTSRIVSNNLYIQTLIRNTLEETVAFNASAPSSYAQTDIEYMNLLRQEREQHIREDQPLDLTELY